MSARNQSGSISGFQAFLTVAMLMAALALSFVDRQILAILVEPIKADLQLSDTAFGALQGLAFAIFYVGFGFPLGWLADRSNRRNLIGAGIVVWSFATIACGTAGSFAALFAWRSLVGIGEAVLSPAAYSMITDAVPKRRLALALALYSSGLYVGSGLALFVGGAVLGWLHESQALTALLPGSPEPWRIVFFFVGLPGLIMAACLFLLPEPPRRQFSGASVSAAPSLMDTLKLVFTERRLFGGFTFGFAFHNMALYALLGWFPAFLIRQYGLSPAEFGTTLGMATVVGGVAGLVAGGFVSDRLMAAGGDDVPIRMAIVSAGGMAVSSLIAIYAGNPAFSVSMFGLVVFFVALPIGTAAAALQLVVPNRFRGQISALYLVSISLAGLSLGPLLPPLISDVIFQDPSRVGDALAITLVIAATLSIAIFLAARGAYGRRYAAIHLAGEGAPGLATSANETIQITEGEIA